MAELGLWYLTENDGWLPFIEGDDPIPPGPELGNVVYTPDEIASWPTSGTELNRLASSWAGNNSRSIPDYGTSITTNEQRDALRQNAMYCKVQAVLAVATGNATRRAKAIEVLDGVKDVTSWTGQSGQINLVCGWTTTLLCQAAAMLDYRNPEFENYLRNVAWPMCDWLLGGNWIATFCDSRLAMASYLKDADLWLDAQAYFAYRIRQLIHHPDYDGSSIVPIANQLWPATGGAPSANLTGQHWWTAITSPPWAATYKGNPLLAGTDAEFIRDISHETMTTNSLASSCRTILANGGTLPQQVIDRTVAHFEFQADRVWTYVNTSVLPLDCAAGDGEWHYGWWNCARLLDLLEEDYPSSLTSLLGASEITTATPVGWNAAIAGPFADGSLL